VRISHLNLSATGDWGVSSSRGISAEFPRRIFMAGPFFIPDNAVLAAGARAFLRPPFLSLLLFELPPH